MARLDSRNDSGSDRSTTSTRAVVTLLGVYTALYLAVVGIIHFTTSPDAAAAIVPEVTRVHVAEDLAKTALPVKPFRGAGGPPAMESIEPEAAEGDNSRECTAGTDTECIYN